MLEIFNSKKKLHKSTRVARYYYDEDDDGILFEIQREDDVIIIKVRSISLYIVIL